LLGGGFFVLMIAPFLGFVPASYLQNSFIFDHFLYLPMIGLIALMIAAAEDLVRRMPRERHWLLTLMLMPIAYFAAESWLYAPTFARPSVFFGAVVRNHPQWWSAHNSLGNALRKEGHPDGALAEFRLASGLAPDRAEPLNNLGALLFEMHRYAEAVEPYEQAIALDPNDAETQTGLGNVYLLIGKLPDAIAEYEAAVKIRPDDAQAHNGLATALMNSGRMPEAQAQVEEAVKLEPDYMQAHATLGLIFAQEGRNDEAIAQFERAQVLAPDDPRIERELEALRVQHVGK
jgi:tetratricopeptide (TPR) repeat protein